MIPEKVVVRTVFGRRRAFWVTHPRPALVREKVRVLIPAPGVLRGSYPEEDWRHHVAVGDDLTNHTDYQTRMQEAFDHMSYEELRLRRPFCAPLGRTNTKSETDGGLGDVEYEDLLGFVLTQLSDQDRNVLHLSNLGHSPSRIAKMMGLNVRDVLRSRSAVIEVVRRLLTH